MKILLLYLSCNSYLCNECAKWLSPEGDSYPHEAKLSEGDNDTLDPCYTQDFSQRLLRKTSYRTIEKLISILFSET